MENIGQFVFSRSQRVAIKTPNEEDEEKEKDKSAPEAPGEQQKRFVFLATIVAAGVEFGRTKMNRKQAIRLNWPHSPTRPLTRKCGYRKPITVAECVRSFCGQSC